jgi:hypothetical protein
VSVSAGGNYDFARGGTLAVAVTNVQTEKRRLALPRLHVLGG